MRCFEKLLSDHISHKLGEDLSSVRQLGALLFLVKLSSCELTV